MSTTRWVGRAIGLDVHREFCEDGVVRSGGRVPATPEGIKTLAESLWPSDCVALEVTGSCWEVARILEPHVNRVIVLSPDDTGISSVRTKTDKPERMASVSRVASAATSRMGYPPNSSLPVQTRRLEIAIALMGNMGSWAMKPLV